MGNNSYNTSGSFAYLLRQYNLATSDTNGTLISKTNAIYNHPLYFLPGGRIQNQKINAIGSAGYFWSSLGGGSSAYTLFMNSTVDPSHSFNTYNGMAIRCLIKGGWLPNGGLDEPLDANQANLSITVSPVISIDATSGMNEAVDFTTVANGNITATVSSNQAYQVLLSTNQSTLEQNPIVTNQSIPMISTDANITAGTIEI